VNEGHDRHFDYHSRNIYPDGCLCLFLHKDWLAKMTKRLDAIRQRLEMSRHNEAGRFAVLNADIGFLLSLVKKQREALNKALEAIKRHDKAYYQCESSEGAQGASDCRNTLEQALKCDEGGEVENGE